MVANKRCRNLIFLKHLINNIGINNYTNPIMWRLNYGRDRYGGFQRLFLTVLKVSDSFAPNLKLQLPGSYYLDSQNLPSEWRINIYEALLTPFLLKFSNFFFFSNAYWLGYTRSHLKLENRKMRKQIKIFFWYLFKS